jgi:hypothetical protein
MIKNRIILNETLCKPIGLTEKQIEEAKIFLKKQQEEKEIEEKKKFGLGDLVAKVAQPIAGAIDSVVGTDIKNCGGCKKRQEYLNNLIPDINPIKKE